MDQAVDAPAPVIGVNEVRFTILGQACSKSNRSQIITIPGRPGRPPRSSIGKSKEAKAYIRTVEIQAPRCEPLLTGELRIEVDCYYSWEGPDLDAEQLFDALQGIVYENDRQLRSKILEHYIDHNNPRVEVRITPRKQPALF